MTTILDSLPLEEAKDAAKSRHAMEEDVPTEKRTRNHFANVSSIVHSTEAPTMNLAQHFSSGVQVASSNEYKVNVEDDAWFSGDTHSLQKGGDQSNFTPPLSLETGDKAPRSIPPHAVPETSSDPAASYGSSTTSSIPRSGSSQNRPLLYSAIGSLESITAASFQSFNNKRLVNPMNETTKSRSHLIPPASSGSDEASTTYLPPQYATSSQNTSNLSSVSIPISGSRNVSTSETRSNMSQGYSNAAEPSRAKPQNGVLRKKRISPGEAGETKVKRQQGKSNSRRVSIDRDALRKKKPVEMFRPSCDAYTPRIEKKRIQYRRAEQRTPVQKMASPMGTLSRPNFRDALRRVAMIVHQHIVKIERRFEESQMERGDQGLFKKSMRETFSEENYCTPTYKCTMVRIPMARPGMIYGLRKIKVKQSIPSEEEIYEFAHQLFKSVQLSSECSIVCLIYVERLMEVAKVPLLSDTWRPIFMCGLLLASKVWQDLSSWNIEFASVYPQYPLDAINRLELNFLRNVKWDLYISSTLYAKYYFALRSLVEKVDFRQRYNRMVGRVDSVAQSEALKISRRTEQFKEEALQQISRSM